jgi:3',5'-nucleoside bisphosphate phosphatase
MKADLHLHTWYSDGTESPSETTRRAAELGFNVVAVTDHDTMAGVGEALESGRKLGIRVIPAVEITAQFRDQELHLLAYFSDEPDNTGGKGWQASEIHDQLQSYSRHRFERARRIVKRLQELGVEVTMEEILEQASSHQDAGSREGGELEGATLGRPHIAAALVARGHVNSVDEAFEHYLKRGRAAWVDKHRPEVSEVISLVHRHGGLTLLAHPGLLRNDRIPNQLREAGLDGVEVYHSRHTPSQSARFRAFAREHDLLVSGGSDCHGMLKGEPLMGKIEFEGEDLERFLGGLSCMESR